MKKLPVLMLMLLVVIGVLFALFQHLPGTTQSGRPVLATYSERERYRTDVIVIESVTIPEGQAVILENDAIYELNEPLTVNGAIGCANGSLTIVAHAPITINDSIICDGADGVGGDITIVAEEGLTISPTATIVAAGDVQILDREVNLRSKARLAELHDEMILTPSSTRHLGPLLPIAPPTVQSNDMVPDSVLSQPAPGRSLVMTPTENVGATPIDISGTLLINTSVQGDVPQMVLIDVPNTPEVRIREFTVSGSAGRTGNLSEGGCKVAGGHGGSAFGVAVFAPRIVVSSTRLHLADGGDGGTATTGQGCSVASAVGGDGGSAGNFILVAQELLRIDSALEIYLGHGGAGGDAVAVAAREVEVDPQSAESGSATAIGGAGADVAVRLSSGSAIEGKEHIFISGAVGGDGGAARAEGAPGLAATVCGETGGPGGVAQAIGGSGGAAELQLPDGINRLNQVADQGGVGGSVFVVGGAGGAGGSCAEPLSGGAGGVGGTAMMSLGNGGNTIDGQTLVGAVLRAEGGAGGAGGDGCPAGAGGAGGSGDLVNGVDGEVGADQCTSFENDVSEENDTDVSVVSGVNVE